MAKVVVYLRKSENGSKGLYYTKHEVGIAHRTAALMETEHFYPVKGMLECLAVNHFDVI